MAHLALYIAAPSSAKHMEPASNIAAVSTIRKRKLLFIEKLLGFIAKFPEIAAGCALARALAAWLGLIFMVCLFQFLRVSIVRGLAILEPSSRG
jgi:hypothetical protein